MPKEKPDLSNEDLMLRESRFVSETSIGLTIDNSEAEGEPFDFSLDDDQDA